MRFLRCSHTGAGCTKKLPKFFRTKVLYSGMAWGIEQQRAYNARYYAAHRESEIERVKSRQRATAELLNELRRVLCAYCGRSLPPHVMDFDHRDPSTKLFALSGKCQ